MHSQKFLILQKKAPSQQNFMENKYTLAGHATQFFFSQKAFTCTLFHFTLWNWGWGFLLLCPCCGCETCGMDPHIRHSTELSWNKHTGDTAETVLEIYSKQAYALEVRMTPNYFNVSLTELLAQCQSTRLSYRKTFNMSHSSVIKHWINEYRLSSL